MGDMHTEGLRKSERLRVQASRLGCESSEVGLR